MGMLFKPMKGVIGSRFVSANDGTETKTENDSLESTVSSSKKAASLKMFGQLTRTKEEWHPARLLCVRFNVAFPYGDHSVTGVAKSNKKDTGVSNVFAALDNVQGSSDNVETETASEEESKSEANDV